MADLAISSVASLTGANLASGDLFPVLDVSASSGSKASSMTPGELFAGLLIRGNTSLGTNVASGVLNLGTITDTTARPLALSQTWNNGSLTGAGLRLSVTDTASAAASLLLDLRGGASGSTSYFTVGKTGTTIIGNPSTGQLEIVGGGPVYLRGLYGGSGTNRCSLWLNRVNGQSIVLNGNASGAGTNEGVYASAGGGGTTEGGTASCVLGGFFQTNTQLSLTVKPINKDALGGYTGDGHLLYLCGGKASALTTGGAGGAAYVIGGDAAGTGNNNGGDVILKGGAATGSGTKGVVLIGEATTDLISFFGGTATAQQPSITDTAGDAGTGSDTVNLVMLNSTLSNMQIAINSLIANLESLNLIASN